jgi:DNA modification methylase
MDITLNMASIKCNHDFIGIELDEKYFKIATNNIETEQQFLFD